MATAKMIGDEIVLADGTRIPISNSGRKPVAPAAKTTAPAAKPAPTAKTTAPAAKPAPTAKPAATAKFVLAGDGVIRNEEGAPVRAPGVNKPEVKVSPLTEQQRAKLKEVKPKTNGDKVMKVKPKPAAAPTSKPTPENTNNGGKDYDLKPWILGAGGAMLGHSVASALFDDTDDERRRKSVWYRLLSTLAPLALGGLGAYGGYRLSKEMWPAAPAAPGASGAPAGGAEKKGQANEPMMIEVPEAPEDFSSPTNRLGQVVPMSSDIPEDWKEEILGQGKDPLEYLYAKNQELGRDHAENFWPYWGAKGGRWAADAAAAGGMYLPYRFAIKPYIENTVNNAVASISENQAASGAVHAAERARNTTMGNIERLRNEIKDRAQAIKDRKKDLAFAKKAPLSTTAANSQVIPNTMQVEGRNLPIEQARDVLRNRIRDLQRERSSFKMGLNNSLRGLKVDSVAVRNARKALTALASKYPSKLRTWLRAGAWSIPSAAALVGGEKLLRGIENSLQKDYNDTNAPYQESRRLIDRQKATNAFMEAVRAAAENAKAPQPQDQQQ